MSRSNRRRQKLKRECGIDESKSPAGPKKIPLIYRLHRAFGPLAGALILDCVDLATFGPLGLGGLFIGAGIGWWISSIYNFSGTARILWAVLAGIYCLMPFTEMIPIATIISAVARFEVKEYPGREERA